MQDKLMETNSLMDIENLNYIVRRRLQQIKTQKEKLLKLLKI
jgi:hypothetical protein